MKLITTLLLTFISVVSFAQIVVIPNANFKAKLLQASPDNQIAFGGNSYITIDANNDGEIQVSEAIAVTELNVNYASINNLTGIEAFVNLRSLDCSQNSLFSLNTTPLTLLENLNCSVNNGITTLNISSNTNLKTLNADFCSLTALNLSNCPALLELSIRSCDLTALNLSSTPNLQSVNCRNNNITSLIISGNNALTYLNCGANNLTSVNLVQCPNLIELECFQNQISTLDVSQNLNLQKLNCGTNQLTTLNVSNITNLTDLICLNNQLASLDVTQNVNLLNLNFSLNQITTLNLAQNQNLTTLNCSSNPITSLDVSGCPNLIGLVCIENQLTSLDVSQNVNLVDLQCATNQIASLDLSQNEQLLNLDCSNNVLTSLEISANTRLNNLLCANNQLTQLFLKNGLQKTVMIDNNPLLTYVCVDEFQITEIQQLVGVGVTVSSYCSALPGGEYNSISGTMLFDSQNNGCESSDVAFPFMKMKMYDGTDFETTFTNTASLFNFYTSVGNFTIFPAVEEMTRFDFSPTDVSTNFATTNETFQQDFCITANGIHPDVEVVIAPIDAAQPGLEATYKVVYKNKGNQSLSGAIDLAYSDLALQFVAATVIPTSSTSSLLTWEYQDLLPFENRSFLVTFNVNSGLSSSDTINFDIAITSNLADEMPEDNQFNYQQHVVNSSEPNSIICLEGDVLSTELIGDYLHYMINFENTGTDEINNVVITIDLDPSQYDIDSLQLLNSSHDTYCKVKGNRVEIFLQNIAVDTGGHGNVLLKVRSLATLQQDDAVANQAMLFYDYNAPIESNPAYSLFQLSTDSFETDTSVVVYPNPSSTVVNIASILNDNNTIKTIELYDVQGRLLQTAIVNNVSATLDIAARATGVYFLKITTEKGVKVEKINKE